MKLKLTLLALLCTIGVELFAQEKSIKTDTHDMSFLDEIGYFPAKESYTYYEDADGNYIKHGNYSIIGKKDESVADGIRSSTHKVDYTLKATYKDGLLNGTVTATKVSVLSGTNHLTDLSAQDTEKQNFSGGYRNGLPHGAWTYTKVLNGKTTHSANMNFTNGVITGNYSSVKDGEKSTGKFDANGFYDGNWDYISTRTQSVYSKGVELSFIRRSTSGSIESKRVLNPDVKDIATKYINGEVTLDQLNEMGYHGNVIDRTPDGYNLCLSETNYLYIGRLSGDLTRTYHNNVVDKKIILGKIIDFRKVNIMTDELLDLICYLDGYKVDEEPTLLAQFKAGYKTVYYKEFKDARFCNTVRDFPRNEDERETKYYGFYAKSDNIACGDKYPNAQYYLTEAQTQRYKGLRDKYNAEQNKLAAERKEQQRIKNIQLRDVATAKKSINTSLEEYRDLLHKRKDADWKKFGYDTANALQHSRDFVCQSFQCIERNTDFTDAEQRNQLVEIAKGLKVYVNHTYNYDLNDMAQSGINNADVAKEFFAMDIETIDAKIINEWYEKHPKDVKQLLVEVNIVITKYKKMMEDRFAQDRTYLSFAEATAINKDKNYIYKSWEMVENNADKSDPVVVSDLLKIALKMQDLVKHECKYDLNYMATKGASDLTAAKAFFAMDLIVAEKMIAVNKLYGAGAVPVDKMFDDGVTYTKPVLVKLFKIVKNNADISDETLIKVLDQMMKFYPMNTKKAEKAAVAIKTYDEALDFLLNKAEGLSSKGSSSSLGSALKSSAISLLK